MRIRGVREERRRKLKRKVGEGFRGTPERRRALVSCPAWVTSAGHPCGSTEPRLLRRGSFRAGVARFDDLLKVLQRGLLKPRGNSASHKHT